MILPNFPSQYRVFPYLPAIGDPNQIRAFHVEKCLAHVAGAFGRCGLEEHTKALELAEFVKNALLAVEVVADDFS